jgi:hypothetical protein
MSRAYVIRVSETLRRHVHLEDGVRTSLEILDVLPPERMNALLRAELARAGFREEDGRLVRDEEGGVRVEVDPEARTVTLRIAGERELELEHTGEGRAYRPGDEDARAALRERVQRRLEVEASVEEGELKSELAGRLERRLADLRVELDRVSHRVVAAALKERAAQLGEVREIAEDEEAQTLTIRIEV